MLFASINLFFQQVKSVVSFLILQFKYKKDFLIVETYSFKEASKVGEFSFNPRVFLFIASFFGFLTVFLTVLVIQNTPLGYNLLSHQKHPMEDEFIQIAHRLKILSDSLQTVDTQIESFKTALRNSDGVQLATSHVGSKGSRELGMGIALKDSEISFTKSVPDTNQISEVFSIELAPTTEFGVGSYVGSGYFMTLLNSIPLHKSNPVQIKVETKKSQ